MHICPPYDYSALSRRDADRLSSLIDATSITSHVTVSVSLFFFYCIAEISQPQAVIPTLRTTLRPCPVRPAPLCHLLPNQYHGASYCVR